jgi:hypothetical protein
MGIATSDRAIREKISEKGRFVWKGSSPSSEGRVAQ